MASPTRSRRASPAPLSGAASVASTVAYRDQLVADGERGLGLNTMHEFKSTRSPQPSPRKMADEFFTAFVRLVCDDADRLVEVVTIET